jgi:hypothetical protein
VFSGRRGQKWTDYGNGRVASVARSEHGRVGRANWAALVLPLRALQAPLLQSTMPAMHIIDPQSSRAHFGAARSTKRVGIVHAVRVHAQGRATRRQLTSAGVFRFP